MSTSPGDELRFYLRNLTKFWLSPKLDLPRIPGPQGWRFVGSAPELARRKDLHRVVRGWVEKYGGASGNGSSSNNNSSNSGNGIVKFWLFGQPIVVVSDPRVAAGVLARPGGGFRGGGSAHGASSSPSCALPQKSIGYSFFNLASSPLDGLRSFFSTTDEAHWARVRKACAPAFSLSKVRRDYFPAVLRHADSLAERLRDDVASASPAASSSSSPHPTVVEVQETIEMCLLDVALEALFAIDLRRVNSEEIARAMSLVLEEAQERVKFPLRGVLGPLLWPRHAARVREAQKILAKLYGRVHDSIRARGAPPAGETALWAALARLRDPADPEGRRPLPRASFMSEAGALMMAGFDTSSHSVGWCLLALAQHPQVQRRLVSELSSHGLLHEAGGSNCVVPRQLTYDDLDPSRLPYLCAVVAEAMRLWPVGATGSVRETTAVGGTRVGPYLLPPGVVVWPMIYALHTSTGNWGDDALVFRPERWLVGGEFAGAAVAVAAGGGGAVSPPPAGPIPDGGGGGGGTPPAPHRGGGAPKRFIPFSDGGKACLGQLLGLTEVKTLVAVLCSRFWFEMPSGEVPKAEGTREEPRRRASPDDGDVGDGQREQIALTLKVRGGLRLVCKLHGLEEESKEVGVVKGGSKKKKG